jgi:uncharacterized protein
VERRGVPRAGWIAGRSRRQQVRLVRLVIAKQFVYTINIRIVWDEPKRRSNLATHGFDLADAELLDWDDVVIVPGHSAKDGRPRFRAIGQLGEELVTIVFSPLGTEAVSVISMRPASNKERKLREEKT